jgi:hypothetical protein
LAHILLHVVKLAVVFKLEVIYHLVGLREIVFTVYKLVIQACHLLGQVFNHLLLHSELGLVDAKLAGGVGVQDLCPLQFELRDCVRCLFLLDNQTSFQLLNLGRHLSSADFSLLNRFPLLFTRPLQFFDYAFHLLY